MKTAQKRLFSHIYKTGFMPILLIIGCLSIAPLYAQNAADLIRKGDDIYVVIKPELSKEVLDRVIAKLKDRGISLRYDNAIFKSGRLTAIDVSIDVAVPGKSTLSYKLTETNDDNSFTPLIFYYEEEGARVGFTKEIPADLSRRGKLVVTDNLVGITILNGDSTETSGRISTTWRMR